MKNIRLVTVIIGLICFKSAISGQTANDSLTSNSQFIKTRFSPLTIGDFPDFFFTLPLSSWRTVYGAGLPVYSAMYCLRPRNTAVMYHGTVLNDPFTGRYNIRFLPADIISGVSETNMYTAAYYPEALRLQTRDIGIKQPYTRAYYNYSAGRESTIGATFGQPLFSGLRYYGGFSTNKYNTETDGIHNTYNNMFLNAHVKLPENWYAAYSMTSSKADVHLPHSLPLPADTLLLHDPVQGVVSKNHIIHFQNDTLTLKPDICYHRHSTAYTFSNAELDTGYTVQSQSNTISASGQTAFLSLPVTIDARYIFRNTAVHDTIGISDSHWCVNVGTRVGLFQNTFAGFAVSPQMHPGNQFRLGYNFHISSSLPKSCLSLDAALNHFYRTPSLSERSGIILYNNPISSESMYNLAQVRHTYCINDELSPESHVSARLSLSLKRRAFQGTVSLFNKHISEYIHPKLSPNGVMFNNTTDGSCTGINSYLASDLFGSLGIISSNSFLFENSLPGLAPPNITGSTAVYYCINLFSNDISATLSVSLRYWDAFYLFDYAFGEDINAVSIPGGAVLNFKALLTIMEYAHISIEYSNISGIASRISGYQYIPERLFRITVLWELFD